MTFLHPAMTQTAATTAPEGAGAAAVATPASPSTGAAPAVTPATGTTAANTTSTNAAVPATAQPRAIVSMPQRPAKTTAHVAQPIKGEAPNAAGAIGGTVFALLLVVGLIFGLAWIARRMPGVANQRNASLRVVASLALGPRERVVVVDVGGTQLLLGVGAGGTRALHTLASPLPVDAPAQAAPFAQLLAQHFGKKQ